MRADIAKATLITRFVAAALASATIGICAITSAVAEESRAATYRLDIPAQSLNDALQALALASHHRLIYSSSVVNGLSAPPLKGEFTAEEAVGRLLAGTDLTYEVTQDGLLIIKSVRAEGPTQPSGNSDAAQADRDSLRVEEVVVTAQKRAQNIQDVPISITAVTGQDIDRRGLVSAEDYLRGIPGVNQVSEKYGASVTIRGIETTPQQQNFSSGTTVATYFGETPTTNTAGVGGGTNVDIKLVDIARVEVLRGPQGTAFGNSSLGGAVRTIPVAPNTGRFEGKVAASYSATAGEGGNNQMIQAIGNVPLIQDTLAVRAVGYRFEDEGFYRNIAGSDAQFLGAATAAGAGNFATDQARVGDSLFQGGRISALWQASDSLRLTASYLTQKTEADSAAHTGGQRAGSSAYDQAILQIAPENVQRGAVHGFYDSDIDVGNATLEYDLGWASVLATYSHIESGSDHSEPVYTYDPIPWSARGTSQHRENSGEIRFATKLSGAWNGLAGVYAEELKDDYTEHSFWYGSTAAELAFLGVPDRDVYLLREQRNLEQRALFGEVSWEAIHGLTLTLGARYYDYDRTGDYRLTGAFGEQIQPTNANESGTSLRGNVSYKLTPDAMIYAGWSQGFRLGKPQPGLPNATCDRDSDGIVDGTSDITIASTRSLKSDEVDNYEIGAKLTLLERRLSLAADVFRIDWTGVPFRVLAPQQPLGCGQSFNANAGAARSQGVEVQATLFVTPALRMDAGSSWIDAELTRDAPGLIPPAFNGDRLPSSPKFNANLAFQYDFTLAGHEAFVRADSIYVGSFYGNPQQSPDTRAGDYMKVDATARVSLNNLSVDLFVRNLTNASEFTFRGVGGEGALYGYRLRPRTVGVQLAYSF